MESFEVQLFLFSMTVALTVVFVLVYNYTVKSLGKDEPVSVDKKEEKKKTKRRTPVTRAHQTSNVIPDIRSAENEE